MTAHFKNRNAVSQAVRDSAEGETLPCGDAARAALAKARGES